MAEILALTVDDNGQRIDRDVPQLLLPPRLKLYVDSQWRSKDRDAINEIIAKDIAVLRDFRCVEAPYVLDGPGQHIPLYPKLFNSENKKTADERRIRQDTEAHPPRTQRRVVPKFENEDEEEEEEDGLVSRALRRRQLEQARRTTQAIPSLVAESSARMEDVIMRDRSLSPIRKSPEREGAHDQDNSQGTPDRSPLRAHEADERMPSQSPIPQRTLVKRETADMGGAPPQSEQEPVPEPQSTLADGARPAPFVGPSRRGLRIPGTRKRARMTNPLPKGHPTEPVPPSGFIGSGSKPYEAKKDSYRSVQENYKKFVVNRRLRLRTL